MGITMILFGGFCVGYALVSLTPPRQVFTYWQLWVGFGGALMMDIGRSLI